MYNWLRCLVLMNMHEMNKTGTLELHQGLKLHRKPLTRSSLLVEKCLGF